MGVKISQLLDQPKLVEVRAGQGFEVNALDLTQLATLISNHRTGFGALFNAGMGGNPDWGSFVVDAPNMVRDIICAAAGVTEEEEQQAVTKLPATVQMAALAEIWGLTVPQPKKLAALLSMVAASLQDVGLSQPASASMVKAPPSTD